MQWIIEILKAIVYGIVSGVSESLMIGSDGHLVLLGALIPFRVSDTAYENMLYAELFGAVLRLGCGAGILTVLFRKKQFRERDILQNAGIGILVYCVLGLLFWNVIRVRLYTPRNTGLGLILFTVICYMLKRRTKIRSLNGIETLDAAEYSFVQAGGLLPGAGIVFSGLTGAYVSGMTQKTAVRYAFLCGGLILTLRGAYGLFASWVYTGPGGIVVLLPGLCSAALVSLVMTAAFLRYVRTRTLRQMMLYRAALGLLILILALLKVLPSGMVM